MKKITVCVKINEKNVRPANTLRTVKVKVDWPENMAEARKVMSESLLYHTGVNGNGVMVMLQAHVRTDGAKGLPTATGFTKDSERMSDQAIQKSAERFVSSLKDHKPRVKQTATDKFTKGKTQKQILAELIEAGVLPEGTQFTKPEKADELTGIEDEPAEIEDEAEAAA
jgi:hypothetical protein